MPSPGWGEVFRREFFFSIFFFSDFSQNQSTPSQAPVMSQATPCHVFGWLGRVGQARLLG